MSDELELEALLDCDDEFSDELESTDRCLCESGTPPIMPG